MGGAVKAVTKPISKVSSFFGGSSGPVANTFGGNPFGAAGSLIPGAEGMNMFNLIQGGMFKGDNNQYAGFKDLSQKGGDFTTQHGINAVTGGKNVYGLARPDNLTLRTSSGELDDKFKQSLGSAFKAMEDKALQEGDTKAAELAREQQKKFSEDASNQLQRQMAGGLAAGMRNLAMRGGATTGSRERLNRDLARGLMSGKQNISGRLSDQNLNISMQDEAMKNRMLQGVGQAQQGVQLGNIQRLAQDIGRQNVLNQNVYGQDMSAFGAGKTADAIHAGSQPAGILSKAFSGIF